MTIANESQGVDQFDVPIRRIYLQPRVVAFTCRINEWHSSWLAASLSQEEYYTTDIGLFIVVSMTVLRRTTVS